MEQFPTKISPGKYAHGSDNPPLQQQMSHPERLLTCLTTRLFNNITLNTKYKSLANFSANNVIVRFYKQSDPLCMPKNE
jgi:hypothetical protein